MNKKITEEEITKQYGKPAGKTEKKNLLGQPATDEEKYILTEKQVNENLQALRLFIKEYNKSQDDTLLNFIEELYNKADESFKHHYTTLETLKHYQALLDTLEFDMSNIEKIKEIETEEETYTYTDNILDTAVVKINNKILDYGKQGNKIDKNFIKTMILERTIKDELYIIKNNPFNNFQYIVSEDTSSRCKEHKFSIYNQTRELQQSLKKQYKRTLDSFQQFYTFEEFMKTLYVYIEEEQETKDILLKDNIIYSFDEMKFSKKNKNLPTLKSRITYNKLTDETRKVLDKFFELMYNEDEFKQFLYLILCCLNKKYAEQCIFLIVDASGVGKTSRLSCTTRIELNTTANSRLLEPQEVYNIVGYNATLINEFQGDNSTNGSMLNNLADEESLRVTRKVKDAITLLSEEKPLLVLIGESLPIIQSLTEGTNRRFLRVPRVSEEFKKINSKDTEKQEFFNILLHKPTEVIEYYVEQIIENNIISNYHSISDTMKTTIKELDNLSESREDIFSNFFEMYPYGRYDREFKGAYLLESKNSFDVFLSYIEENYITVRHITDKGNRRKNFYKYIKTNTGKSVSSLGRHQERTKVENKTVMKSYYYGIQLTDKGKELIDNLTKENKIDTIDYIYVSEDEAIKGTSTLDKTVTKL